MPLSRSKARRQGRSRHGVKEQADRGVVIDETNSQRASGEGMVGCVEDERFPQWSLPEKVGHAKMKLSEIFLGEQAVGRGLL